MNGRFWAGGVAFSMVVVAAALVRPARATRGEYRGHGGMSEPSRRPLVVRVAARSERQVAEDRQAFGRYQSQLHELLLDSERRQGGAPLMAPSPTRGEIAGCKLFAPEAHSTEGRECMSCHALHASHPVDVDYESVRSQRSADLRSSEEVVRRGVFLPDGKVRCATCHDARSRWKYFLVLPPGAMVRAPVNPHDASTYAEGARPPRRAELVPSGSEVSPTPLCIVCHTTAD